MKKLMIIAVCLFLLLIKNIAQELYVFTEPASNMATKSIGLRLNNYWMKNPQTSTTNYLLAPEIMVGASKKLMLHGDVYLSNQNQSGVGFQGGSVYGKYRFYSNDDVQRHFRMALYARASANSSKIMQEDINLNGQNSGYDVGIVATQLLHKVAISSSIGFEHATDNGSNNKLLSTQNNSALAYTLSVGKLVLPRNYTNFKQTNVNVIVEMLGQTNTGNAKSYLDIAPALQFIFNSRARVDVGYRQQLYSSLLRSSSSGALLRLEYNLFNAF